MAVPFESGRPDSQFRPDHRPVCHWVDKYPVISIEDGMSEHDWEGWKQLTARLGKSIQLVGDDVFVTNTKILREGIRQGWRIPS